MNGLQTLCQKIFRDTVGEIDRERLLKSITCHAKSWVLPREPPGDSPQDMGENIYSSKDLYSEMLIAAFFIIAQNTEHIPDFHQLLKR